MNDNLPDKQIRILLADDHPLIRAGIRASIAEKRDLLLIGEAINGTEVAKICAEQLVDVLVLDISMPGTSARETVAMLKDKYPLIKVLILTAYDDDVYVRTLISLGVKGYLLKDDATETVVSAIRTVYEGGTCFSKGVVNKLINGSIDDRTETYALSNRELEILSHLKEGCTNREVANKLCISERTVRYHVDNVIQKLRVRNRLEAVSKALGKGLIN